MKTGNSYSWGSPNFLMTENFGRRRDLFGMRWVMGKRNERQGGGRVLCKHWCSCCKIVPHGKIKSLWLFDFIETIQKTYGIYLTLSTWQSKYDTILKYAESVQKIMLYSRAQNGWNIWIHSNPAWFMTPCNYAVAWDITVVYPFTVVNVIFLLRSKFDE